MEPLLEMKNISKYFGGLCAVSRVSLSVGKGEVVGLVGDNAAGKSTLMKILAGAYSPSEGEIFFASKQLKKGLTLTDNPPGGNQPEKACLS